MAFELESIPSGESFSGTLNPARTIILQSILSEEVVDPVVGTTTISLTSIASGGVVNTIAGLTEYFDLSSIFSGESFGVMGATVGYVPPVIPINRPITPLSIPERFSGIILNQNQVSSHETPLSLDTDYNLYQEFFLPKDYMRGAGTVEARTPPLTGFQVLVNVDRGYEDTATLDWTIERYEFGVGWQQLSSGTSIGTNRSGDKVWFTVYADSAIEIVDAWLSDRYRIGIRGRDTTENEFKLVVPYDNGIVTIDGFPIEARLRAGIPYHFEHEGSPSVLHLDAISGKVYYSTERGAASVWITTPNPFSTANVKAYESDGTTPLQVSGQDTSINFRILAGIAEEGTDFLGNRFRSALLKTTVDAVSMTDSTFADEQWLSKPNPSKFAVESLYFDISDYRDQPVTVDHILMDPMTPGVFFNVYYSSEGDPGTNELEWADKLWNRIPEVFQAKNRFRHALPQPVTARYMKIEFSHLQPRWYAPGTFQKPILYTKHPKWVLDYFLAREAQNDTDDPFIARRVGVQFNALDLAYNYYLDDLDQQPLTPNQLGTRDLNELTDFLKLRTDDSDHIDADTFRQIQTLMAPYTQHPAVLGSLDYLPSTYALGASRAIKSGERVLYPDYPFEVPPDPTTPNNLVSNVNREQLVIENGLPVMYFFITSRHRYRQVTAKLDNDKAYFAGVKEIAFQRDHYTQAHDNPLYLEAAGDNTNVERNDFILNGTRWETHE